MYLKVFGTSYKALIKTMKITNMTSKPINVYVGNTGDLAPEAMLDLDRGASGEIEAREFDLIVIGEA